MTSKAVYVVNIDGEQYRRPAENSHVQMYKIKKDIQTYFKLDYEFDLTYKGSKISDTSSLDDNCFDDHTPLVVVQKKSNLQRQIPRPVPIHKVSSLNDLYEEDIEDETELHSHRSAVSHEAFQWKPKTIIHISPATSVTDEQINVSVHTSISRIPTLTVPINRTIQEPIYSIAYPPFSQVGQPTTTIYRQTGRSPIRQQEVRVNMTDKTDSIENLAATANQTVFNKSSNETSGYSSSSSSRSSSPEISNFYLLVPTANRESLKRNETSSYIKVRLQTLNDSHTLHFPTTATVKQFYQIAKQEIIPYDHSQKHHHRTHTLLYFNYRMHIFKDTDIDNEHLSSFLTLKTGHSENSHSIPDFFVYALRKELVEKMYVYEQDPTIIFSDSIWWRSHSRTEQTSLAQSTLLSTLYVLYQYFRRPPLNEKASRRALEIQFLLYLRRYLFPPAFQALKHLLIRQIFAFEKAVLIDGLLHLLTQFCPSSVEQSALGLYAPHLICWLFERSQNEMETQDGFVLFQLMRYPNNSTPHYINDPVTIHDINHDRDVLYEYHEAERYKNITRNVDLFSLIKYLQNPMQKDIVDIDTYTIDMWGCHEMKVIDRLNKECITEHEKLMSCVYRSFTLLIRNALENSDVRDQLILVSNIQVGICFNRRQQLKADGRIDDDLECFMPTDATYSGIVTLNSDDVFEAEPGRPNSRIPSALRSNFPMKAKHVTERSLVEQITLILLDINESMFKRISNHCAQSRSFLDISRHILRVISQNLHQQSRIHAIGIVLFGRHTVCHCPITTNRYEFEKAVGKIPNSAHPWSCIYDALNSGIQQISSFELNHQVASDCKKLIICITHGIDKRGILMHNSMNLAIRHNPVVIDLILLPPDMPSHSPEERNNIADLRIFCTKTRGTVYRNSSMEPIDLAMTYGREAVLSLHERAHPDSIGFGIGTLTDWPVAKESYRLYQTAHRARIPKNMTHDLRQRSGFLARILAEIIGIVRRKIENIDLYILRNRDGQLDYTFWKVILQGPKESLYVNHRWLIYIIFSGNYPVVPPEVRFHTPIFHLNITADGYISHHLFDIAWSTVISMVEIFRTINKLLIEPDVNNAVSEEHIQLYKENRSGYESLVKQYCEKHASKKIDELKRFFRLEN